jgi:hypothetical protein
VWRGPRQPSLPSRRQTSTVQLHTRTYLSNDIKSLFAAINIVFMKHHEYSSIGSSDVFDRYPISSPHWTPRSPFRPSPAFHAYDMPRTPLVQLRSFTGPILKGNWRNFQSSTSLCLISPLIPLFDRNGTAVSIQTRVTTRKVAALSASDSHSPRAFAECRA